LEHHTISKVVAHKISFTSNYWSKDHI
jgi:hypothetical protein